MQPEGTIVYTATETPQTAGISMGEKNDSVVFPNSLGVYNTTSYLIQVRKRHSFRGRAASQAPPGSRILLHYRFHGRYGTQECVAYGAEIKFRADQRFSGAT